jgi:hypothetical protein
MRPSDPVGLSGGGDGAGRPSRLVSSRFVSFHFDSFHFVSFNFIEFCFPHLPSTIQEQNHSSHHPTTPCLLMVYHCSRTRTHVIPHIHHQQGGGATSVNAAFPYPTVCS